MGCSRSRSSHVVNSDDSISGEWRIPISTIDDPKSRLIDPALPPLENKNQIHMLQLLREPGAQQALATYASKINKKHILMCWAEIEEFKIQQVPELQVELASAIYNRYVEENSPQRLLCMTSEDFVRMTALIYSPAEQVAVDAASGKYDKYQSVSSLLSELQYMCFMTIFNDLYNGFTSSEDMKALQEDMNSRYNKVKVNDFELFEVLGQGSYGCVLRVRKKTTQKFYALKIMLKAELLHSFHDDKSKVDTEVRVLAALRHPFIIGMEYSFQDKKIAYIVMELAAGGTMATIKDLYRNKCLKEVNLRFYLAEISEALHYLHGVGIIYRDLKPANVLIDLDGHVKLADMGGVSDIGGDVTNSEVDKSLSTYTCVEPRYKPAHLENPERRRSVTGTLPFMSPEMLQLMTKRAKFAPGYTYMTDWWSMGIMAYMLATGSLPYKVIRVDRIIPDSCMLDILEGGLNMPEAMSPECVDFICRLLEPEDTKRLGWGLKGLASIQNHPFYENFEWSKVLKKTFKPPIVPYEMEILYDPDTEENPVYPNFMAIPLKHSEFIAPEESDQKYFASWDFVDPATLRIEFGLAGEEEQYRKKEKVKKVMGDYSSLGRAFSSNASSRSKFSTTSSTNVNSPKIHALHAQLSVSSLAQSPIGGGSPIFSRQRTVSSGSANGSKLVPSL